jgi:hypothetical protein
MGKNPDDWPEVVAPGAFDGIDQDVPLTFGGPGGPVIGTAHAKGTPEGLQVSATISPPEED